jgi:thioredoxin-like negative regulator of GroEL
MVSLTRTLGRSVAAALAGALAALSPGPAASAQEASGHGSAIAWFPGDVDAAFARARSAHKPLFLYWGASWCPPCNEVKATIFRRADFVERSRQFVPVYVDGDQPSAQKLADRFRVRGYPTMILFAPDGAEITRLPGEIDPQQYLEALALGLGSGRSARATLRAALGEAGRGLTAGDWTLLATYSWDTDEGQLVAADRVASTLAALAKACPASYQASSDRLALRAIVAATGSRAGADPDRARALARVQAVLQDPARARAVFDLLVDYAPQIVGWLTDPGSGRAELAERWDARLAAFGADTTLATADRLDALAARAGLSRIVDPNQAIEPTLAQAIRAAVTKADLETTDRFERQAVISSAADALSAAGLDAESDALLKAELARSAAPYYFMVDLALNARKRGDAATALDWYDKAYAAAQGPATRIQWGSRYVIALTELAPGEADRIDLAVAKVIADLEAAPETFYGRNRVALEKMGAALRRWDSAQAHEVVMRDAAAKMDAVCDKLPQAAPERAVCTGVLRASSPSG